MADHVNNEPAFPSPIACDGGSNVRNAVEWAYGGMSLRDYFAAKAMQGFISNMTYGGELQRIFDADKKIKEERGEKPGDPHAYLSQLAYHLADAMLIERAKESRR